MKIKRYIANDSQEAMVKIRAELGMEAVILHTRKIKKQGVMGFFQKPMVEVVAAIEESQIHKEENHKVNMAKNGKIESFSNNKIDKMQDQLNSIEGMLLDIINTDGVDGQGESGIFDKYLEILEDNDVEKDIAAKILKIANKQIKFTDENEDAIKKAIRVIMKEYLGPPSTVTENDRFPRTIIFIGPTGVGKTTTLAKLAAKFSIRDNKQVGLITSDTYRIAAVEQLRTYGEILDIPLKVIYDPEEIKEAIDEMSNKDIILIDTAGRNHRMEEQLIETKTIIENVPNPDIFLLISATTTFKDIRSIVQSYSFIENYRLIFTKLDEAITVGNILNTKVLTGKNLAYLTTGQTVPDDFEVATPEKIVDLIVGE